MKEIKLTQGQVAVVDDADYEHLSQWKWHAALGFGRFYATRMATCVDGKRRQIKMHRVLLGFPVGKEVDHIDGDSLNNRRSNLRVATRKENARNVHRWKTASKSSRFLGVFWNPKSKNWRSQIRVEGKLVEVGSFATEEEAASARDEASKKFYGAFASLNFDPASAGSERKHAS